MTHFMATTSDGTILRRSSTTRDYKYCVTIFNETTKKWGSGSWTSRLDLAHRERDRIAKYVKGKTEILEAKIIDNKKANEVRKSKTTDADRRASKVASKLRKLGFDASKRGKYVWTTIRRKIGPAHTFVVSATWDVTVRYGHPDYERQASEYYRRARYNRRIVTLLIKNYLIANGFGGDLDIIRITSV